MKTKPTEAAINTALLRLWAENFEEPMEDLKLKETGFSYAELRGLLERSAATFAQLARGVRLKDPSLIEKAYKKLNNPIDRRRRFAGTTAWDLIEDALDLAEALRRHL